jgi:hypothetical protein
LLFNYQIYSSDGYGYENYETCQSYQNYANTQPQTEPYSFNAINPMVGQSQNTGINLMNINTSNLTQEEQAKLINITNLQNSINNTINPNCQVNETTKDGRGEKNVKRDLSEREKVELELKKWNKEQKKVILLINLA